MNQDSNNQQQAVPKPAKKAYRKPNVLVYGNLREITQAAGNMGNMDGGAVMGMMMSRN